MRVMPCRSCQMEISASRRWRSSSDIPDSVMAWRTRWSSSRPNRSGGRRAARSARRVSWAANRVRWVGSVSRWRAAAMASTFSVRASPAWIEEPSVVNSRVVSWRRRALRAARVEVSPALVRISTAGGAVPVAAWRVAAAVRRSSWAASNRRHRCSPATSEVTWSSVAVPGSKPCIACSNSVNVVIRTTVPTGCDTDGRRTTTKAVQGGIDHLDEATRRADCPCRR